MKSQLLSPVAADTDEETFYEIAVDQTSDQEWDAILTGFADASVYQTHAYGAVRRGERNLSRLVMSKHGEVLAAAQLRILRAPLLRAGIAYLRWGPLCQRKGKEISPDTVNEIARALRQEYVTRRGLVLQVLSNAYCDTSHGTIFQRAFESAGFRPDQSLPHYRTIVVDLTPSLEDLRKNLAQKWRNQLNQAARNGMEVRADRTDTSFQTFLQLYKTMWERKRFSTSVNEHEFGQVHERLPMSEKMQIFLSCKDGRPVGALICSLIGSTAIYLLGATNEEGRSLKAAYLLQWKAIEWLKQNGALSYDLGGVDAVANPGGHHFKKGIGGSEVLHIAPQIATSGRLNSFIYRGLSWLRSRQAKSKQRPDGAQ